MSYHELMLNWLETARHLKAIGDDAGRRVALTVARGARRKHKIEKLIQRSERFTRLQA